MKAVLQAVALTENVADEVPDDVLRRDLRQHNIAARLPLAAIARAHELVESGSVVSNVVVSID